MKFNVSTQSQNKSNILTSENTLWTT